eukprot:gene6830-16613_t
MEVRGAGSRALAALGRMQPVEVLSSVMKLALHLATTNPTESDFVTRMQTTQTLLFTVLPMVVKGSHAVTESDSTNVSEVAQSASLHLPLFLLLAKTTQNAFHGT